MKPVIITLKQRFAITLMVITILIIVFMATAINQFRKIEKYNQLLDQTIILSEQISDIDSVQTILFQNLPRDIIFFKTQKNTLLDNLRQSINKASFEINHISNHFYLKNNSQIRIKAFELNQQLKKYLEALDKYQLYTFQKGFEQYGINGQINLLGEKIINLASQDKAIELQNKVEEIIDLKNQYLLTKDFTLINKIKINLEEAKTIIILSNKPQKITLLTSVEKLENHINNLFDLDRAIGFTSKDGIAGKMKLATENYKLGLMEFRKLIKADMKRAVNWGYFWLALLFMVTLIDIWLIYYRINKYIHKPLEKLSNFLSEMVRGKLPEKLRFKRKDEIAQMGQYLNNLVDGLHEKARFATEIGQNKLSVHYQPLSEDDILGNALIEMQKSLQKAEQEDIKYKNEEKKRIWTNEGLAKFGEILRLHNNDINILSDETIQNLVKYLNAIQGALYFINDENPQNPFIELISAFAYDRKKYLKQHIEIGEGLIGTAVLEKEKIFITDIPENYLTITSGLGEAPPRSILIVPLKHEDKILGVVELASFQIFEPHEIEFVEKISETIASTIVNVKINAQTARLLEKSQRQAEEMAEQEEEMRQNMEELRTTQEDFARREAELQGLINAVNISSMLMTLDSVGKIIEVNQKLLTFLQTKPEEIIGRSVIEFVNLNKENFDLLWEQLSLGKVKSTESKIRIANGIELMVKQVFAPVFDKNGVLTKVLLEFIDYTEQHELEKNLEHQNKENQKLYEQLNKLNLILDTAFLHCEFSAKGVYTHVNDNYCRIVGLSPNELVGKGYLEYLKDDEKEQFIAIWNEVLKDKPYSGVLKRTRPTGESSWIMASILPIKNEKQQIEKILLLAQDVTERKLKYQLLEEANKEIERLKKERNSEK